MGVPFFAPASRQRIAESISRGRICPSAYAQPSSVCAGAVFERIKFDAPLLRGFEKFVEPFQIRHSLKLRVRRDCRIFRLCHFREVHIGDLPDFHSSENFVERREGRGDLDSLENASAHFGKEREFSARVGGVQQVCGVLERERGRRNLPPRRTAAQRLAPEDFFEFRARVRKEGLDLRVAHREKKVLPAEVVPAMYAALEAVRRDRLHLCSAEFRDPAH